MLVGRCRVDAETWALERERIDTLSLADVRSLLQARDVLDVMLSDAIDSAWAAGVSRAALALLLGVHRSVLYRRMSGLGRRP